MEGRKKEIENHKALWVKMEREKTRLNERLKAKWRKEREREK